MALSALADALILDLRGRDYDLSGSWRNLAAASSSSAGRSGLPSPVANAGGLASLGSGGAGLASGLCGLAGAAGGIDVAAVTAGRGVGSAGAAGCPEAAIVPETVEFDEVEKAFIFAEGGDVVSIPLATNPWALRSVTYAAWIKVLQDPQKNLAWIMCQSPDYGWSRAVTLNDYRLGHVSIATSRYWDSGLGRAPIGEWIHVVGVWCCDTDCTVYLNGVRGASIAGNNGKSADTGEELFLIGGRCAEDSAHNAAVKISDVSVFSRALNDGEVQALYQAGRTSGENSLASGLGPSFFGEEEVEPATPPRGTASANGAWPSPAVATLGSSSPLPALPGSPGYEDPPVWDEATGLFWCSTGISAYDIPDGEEWQQKFKDAMQTSQVQVVVKRRGLQRHTSDAPAPAPDETTRQRRTLARFPSDPDKRAARAAHTEALQHMPSSPGLQARVQGRRLALFRFGGTVFAADAACPHQGANLCEGEIGDIEDMVLGKRYYVRCKVHKFQVDLVTGSVLEGHCPPLRTYSARIRHSADMPRAAAVEVGFESLGERYFCSDDSSGAGDF